MYPEPTIPNLSVDNALSLHCFPTEVRIALNCSLLRLNDEKGETRLSQIVRVPYEEMMNTSMKVLTLVGAPENHATSVSKSLVQAQQSGHTSHGVMRLSDYVEFVQQGLIIPKANPEIKSERGAVINVEGNWGWGQVACKFSVELVAERVSKFGIASVAINSCNHIGRLGEYVEMLAKKSFVALMFCNTGPSVSAYGGKTRLFGTNPMAAAIPAEDGDIVIDFATAGTAEGKLRVALAAGEEIPSGLVITKDGKPTNDPSAFYEGGSLVPFGGHKGYCLSLLIELLSGSLSGVHPAMNSEYDHGNGTLLIAMDPDFFVGAERFGADIAEAKMRIKQAPSVNPETPILLPGELEANTQSQNRDAIEIPEKIWETVRNLEKSLQN